ncbi:MAG: hypothetical protein AAGB31_05295 [Bdellovibrio sp.]
MRKRTALTLILGLLLGIAGVAYIKQPPTLSSRKAPLLMPSRQPSGKHLAMFKLEITTEESIPESGTDVVHLVGRVAINQELSAGGTYAWSLPEGVEVVSGSLTDALPTDNLSNVIELHLFVSGFNKETQKLISLQVSGQRGQQVLGGSALIASRPEDTLEATAAEMRQRAEEQLGPSPKFSRRQ